MIIFLVYGERQLVTFILSMLTIESQFIDES